MAEKGAFEVDHEQIASLVQSTYLNTIPPRGAKPGTKSNGRIEWSVLAGYILSYTTPDHTHPQYALISLATGLKCLPYTSLPPNGDVLHDQHAEVLARRGARLWLLQRLEHEVKSSTIGEGFRFFERTARKGENESERKWKLRQGVKLHLYVSTLPCGDASNNLLEFQRAAQDQIAGRMDVPTPAELLALHSTTKNTSYGASSAFTSNSGGGGSVVRGRASSSNPAATHTASGSAGSLRTKPGRPDSPPSISMSCSDKLALWNAPGIGIQGSLLSALLEPAFIYSISIADHPIRHIFPAFPLPSSAEEVHIEQQREDLKTILAEDCKRALQRARTNTDDEIIVGWSTTPFADSKEVKLESAWSSFDSAHPFNADTGLAEKMEVFRASYEPVTCSSSILYVRNSDFGSSSGKGKVENLATGTKLGAPTKRPKPKDPSAGLSEPLKPQARSSVCRLNYFQAFLAAYSAITGAEMIQDENERVTYIDAKEGAFGDGTREYRRRKEELFGGKKDAQRVLETFLKGARDGTAIKGTQKDVVQEVIEEVAEQDEEREEEEAGRVGLLQGWLRTPSALSQFDLNGRTTRTTHAHRLPS
ncbi:related to tRNA-specific adenosine deaminase 1 [Ustilago trichophora]|uniref:Related to tRNA-specific adenosine deaminase 1 n=1 Tax=Ustilago trichophora TaxID=86804 RepID=A0A5C3EQS7_9BASI|nr:related to tRNA-specific adenosine deaminase 1 [Ustilago trichophora]